MLNQRLVCTLILACASCGTMLADGPENAGKVRLRLNLKQGEQRVFAYAMEATSDIQMGERTISTAMQLGMRMGISTVDVDASGNHTLTFQYNRVTFAMSGGGIQMDYDSQTDTPDNPATKAFAAMVGTALTFELAPDGTVIKTAGLDELARKLGKELPGGEDALQQRLEKTQSQVGQIFAIFPDKPVGIGDTWDMDFDAATAPQPETTVRATCTLAKRENGKALIQVSGVISGMENGVSGDMKGTIRVDEATGWTESGEMVITTKGKVQGVTIDTNAKINFGSGQRPDSAER